MRKLSTIVLVAGAAIAVSVTTGGSAYAGEATTSRLDAHPVFVHPSTMDYQDELRSGCGSDHKELKDQSASVNG